jgi:hypothetical protein
VGVLTLIDASTDRRMPVMKTLRRLQDTFKELGRHRLESGYGTYGSAATVKEKARAKKAVVNCILEGWREELRNKERNKDSKLSFPQTSYSLGYSVIGLVPR